MTASIDRLLVVDDELAQREALRRFLARSGFEVDAVESAEQAVERLALGGYALLITDLRLPEMDGLALVRHVRERDPEIGVLLITAFASVESAVEALRLGAQDYLLKPLILEEVERKVRTLLSHRRLLQENALLRRLLQARETLIEVTAESAVMQHVTEWIRRAAGSTATVLITGETGTGKEVVARSIHRSGAHAEEPFLAVNLAAIPGDMVESELFGHERGAFTGAVERRRGILRAAGHGTVFLDEIAELRPEVQVKLLRVLESREVRPLGSDATEKFDARVIAATHRDLAHRVAEGSFRQDLFYRLDVLRIHVPPLRDRREDIPLLVHELLRRHAQRAGVNAPLLTADAMRALCRHTWRGNVRELSNVLERALILVDDGRIGLEQLPADVRAGAEAGLSLKDAIDRAERSHIALVLGLASGNRELAARELQVSPATLYRRLEKHGLGVTAPETDGPASQD